MRAWFICDKMSFTLPLPSVCNLLEVVVGDEEVEVIKKKVTSGSAQSKLVHHAISVLTLKCTAVKYTDSKYAVWGTAMIIRQENGGFLSCRSKNHIHISNFTSLKMRRTGFFHLSFISTAWQMQHISTYLHQVPPLPLFPPSPPVFFPRRKPVNCVCF